MSPGLGILIGLPIATIFTFASIVTIIIGISQRSSRDSYDQEDGNFLLGIGAIVLVLTVGITAVAFWPYQKQYHYWQPIDGRVENISSRILPSGDAMEQKFVVKLEDDPHPYGIQDTRAALLKKGDSVNLSCIRKWEFASGDHGYDCRWGSYS